MYENINIAGQRVTVINVCANHYTKIIVDRVYSHFQIKNNNHYGNRKIWANIIINWICLVFNFTSKSDTEKWFRLLGAVLLSQYTIHALKNAIMVLKNNYHNMYKSYE